MEKTQDKQIKIDFTWNVDRSAATEDTMYSRLYNTLNKFKFGYMNVTCEITKEGSVMYVVKLVLEIPSYRTIAVKDANKEILTAFDKANEELFLQINKAKSEKQDY